MSLILSLETATDVCSVALHDNDRLIVDFNLHVERAHSKSLAKLVDEVFQYSGLKKIELGAVAVSKGPGSYTGLRIGTSLAKGICFGLNIPLIAVNTLEAMAYQVSVAFSKSYLCPMIDARRMEVYCLIKDGNFNDVLDTHNKVIEETSFSDLLVSNQVVFFGNGSGKCQEILGVNNNAIFVEGIEASAKFIGALANKKYIEKDFEDLAYFEPFYLKEFRAGKPRTLV